MNRKKDKKKRHDFWRRINFKYKASIINENTLSEVFKLRVSWFSGAVVVAVFAFVMIVLTSVIIITTPIRNYLPGYLDSEIREQAIQSGIQIDSLEHKIQYQANYLNNLKAVLSGEVLGDSIPYATDSIIMVHDERFVAPSKREKEYNVEYEDAEKYNLSSTPSGSALPAEGTSFFRPVKGLLTHKFDLASRHYGVSMMTAPRESVVATQEGSIVYTGYDAQSGHVIQIQHKNGYLSIYKNNASLLKKIGDRVSTGEAIAIVGKQEGSKDKASLYFELWYKGNPVNPENYISF